MFYYEISRRNLGLGKLSFVLSVVCELFGKFTHGLDVQNHWMDRPEFADWLRRDSTDVFRAYCRV